MLSSKNLLCLAVVAAIFALSCNHCSLHCLVNFVSAIPFVGDFLGHLLPLTGNHVHPKTETKTSEGNGNQQESPTASEAVAGEGLFTVEQLKSYTGEKGLYLAILGIVYDVKRGERHYAKGNAYHHFTGIDGSRAFTTGDFTADGLRDDVLDFTPTQFLALENWVGNYKRDYPAVGKLIGRYYDESGEPTEYLNKVLAAFANAHEIERIKEERTKKYPPCNSRWVQEEGGNVWCSDMSGGIARGWSGVPRQLFEAETGKTRCACVQLKDVDDPNMKEYDNCAKDSESCPLAPLVAHPGVYFDEGQEVKKQ